MNCCLFSKCGAIIELMVADNQSQGSVCMPIFNITCWNTRMRMIQVHPPPSQIKPTGHTVITQHKIRSTALENNHSDHGVNMKMKQNICTFKKFLQFNIYNANVSPTYILQWWAITEKNRKENKMANKKNYQFHNSHSFCPQIINISGANDSNYHFVNFCLFKM